jgi:hypothetical protein
VYCDELRIGHHDQSLLGRPRQRHHRRRRPDRGAHVLARVQPRDRAG